MTLEQYYQHQLELILYYTMVAVPLVILLICLIVLLGWLLIGVVRTVRTIRSDVRSVWHNRDS